MAHLNSRLIVKNLPKTVTEAKIRKVFGAKGIVTDVQLKYTPDGQFRGFAFIGFKTPIEAENACSYFNQTFIGTSKIQVETCSGLGDPLKPKAWSKHAPEHYELAKNLKRKHDAEQEEAKEKKQKMKKKEEEILDKCKEDPAFLEFLESHRQKSAWGNDEIMDELERQISNPEDESTEKKEKKSKKRKIVDNKEEEEVEESDRKEKKNNNQAREDSSLTNVKSPREQKVFFTVKLTEVPTKAKKKDIKNFFAPLVAKSIRLPRKFRGIAYVGFRTEEEREKALFKHKSFLLGNKIYLKTINLPNLTTFEAKKNEQRNAKWTEQQTELEVESEPVGESGRIFIRNLSYLTNEDEIRSIFEEYGPVTEVHLPLDRLTRRIKGFGFVSFMLPEHALNAFSNLDGTVFQGRMLHLLPSKQKEDAPEDKTGGSSFKNARAIKQKKTAGSTHNWNSLFLGQNAVSEVAAEKYGLSKEELLLDRSEESGRNKSSIGVRMALAEAEIVDETERFLESNGVSLAAFENVKTERSKTCMLVKNLQGTTNAQDLMELFTKHGEVGRILLPRSGMTAIVEFLEPAEARAAFKKLAYSKFGGMPLYLEWAPVDIFSTSNNTGSSAAAGTSSSVVKNQGNKSTERESDLESIKEAYAQKLGDAILEKTAEVVPESSVDEDMVPELDTTLFVKNLNFDTDEASLKKHLSQVGPIFNATVARKRDSKHPGQTLSMGYGFVQFYRTNDASNALKNLQGTMLQNHVLELKRSNRTLQSDKVVPKQTGAEEDPSTKLLVRNVPFQASKEEIVSLFTTFGELRACRLPLKLDGSGDHRGFAFVEFLAQHDAKRAMDTLAKSTHLYGRRLVIEWATKTETVEELREKTAKHFSRQTSGNVENQGSVKKMMSRYFNAQPKKVEDDE